MVSHIPHFFPSEETVSIKICAGETALREEKPLPNQQISPFFTPNTHSKGLFSQSEWNNHHTGSIPILPSSPGSPSERFHTAGGLIPGSEELTALLTPGLLSHPFPAQALIRNSMESTPLVSPGEGNLAPFSSSLTLPTNFCSHRRDQELSWPFLPRTAQKFLPRSCCQQLPFLAGSTAGDATAPEGKEHNLSPPWLPPCPSCAGASLPMVFY